MGARRLPHQPRGADAINIGLSIGPKSGTRFSGQADAKSKTYSIGPNMIFGPML